MENLDCPKVVLVVRSLGDNGLSRAYALWMILEKMNVSIEILSSSASEIWPPLAKTEFARLCRSAPQRQIHLLVAHADLVIALKPLPESLGICLAALTSYEKLVVDLDDPDLEHRLDWHNVLRQLAAEILKWRRMRELRKIRAALPQLNKTVSSAALQAKHLGTIVPHVREVFHAPVLRERNVPLVVFTGTPRRHKGIERLREAVAIINKDRIRVELAITADAPKDANSWEKWKGPLSFHEARALESQAALAVVLIEGEPWRSFQTPAKAVDATIAGIPVLHNDTEPLREATMGLGYVVSELSPKALSEAIIKVIRTPESRSSAELAAARKHFAPDSYVWFFSQMLRLPETR